MGKEIKYHNFQDILKFLSFDYKFDTKDGYPFNHDPKNIVFAWGQIIIPEYGIIIKSMFYSILYQNA